MNSNVNSTTQKDVGSDLVVIEGLLGLDANYEIRLLKKRLTLLEGELAERELELATLEGMLLAFNHRYIQRVGNLFAQLDEIEAKIAEAFAAMNPEREDLRETAEEARQKSRSSSREAEETAKMLEAKTKFNPTEDVKSSISRNCQDDPSRSGKR